MAGCHRRIRETGRRRAVLSDIQPGAKVEVGSRRESKGCVGHLQCGAAARISGKIEIHDVEVCRRPGRNLEDALALIAEAAEGSGECQEGVRARDFQCPLAANPVADVEAAIEIWRKKNRGHGAVLDLERAVAAVTDSEKPVDEIPIAVHCLDGKSRRHGIGWGANRDDGRAVLVARHVEAGLRSDHLESATIGDGDCRVAITSELEERPAKSYVRVFLHDLQNRPVTVDQDHTETVGATRQLPAGDDSAVFDRGR